MHDDYPMQITRRTLDLQGLGMTVRQSMRVNVTEDRIRGELEHRLAAYVLADHVAAETFTATTTSEWPATTWQMFKHRHASSWWLRWLVIRRPVRMQTDRQQVVVEVDRFLRYPEANLDLPSLGRPVIFERVRQIEQ